MIINSKLITSAPTIKKSKLEPLFLKGYESLTMCFIGKLDSESPLHLGSGDSLLVGGGSGFSFGTRGRGHLCREENSNEKEDRIVNN